MSSFEQDPLRHMRAFGPEAWPYVRATFARVEREGYRKFLRPGFPREAYIRKALLETALDLRATRFLHRAEITVEQNRKLRSAFMGLYLKLRASFILLEADVAAARIRALTEVLHGSDLVPPQGGKQ